MDYTDYLSITLTALAVLLAGLTLVVGVLAIWGYSQFKTLTREASEKHVTELLADGPVRHQIDSLVISHVSSQLRSGELRRILIERIDQILLSDAQTRAERSEAEFSGEPFSD